jgi:hypothetical protein
MDDPQGSAVIDAGDERASSNRRRSICRSEERAIELVLEQAQLFADVEAA